MLKNTIGQYFLLLCFLIGSKSLIYSREKLPENPKNRKNSIKFIEYQIPVIMNLGGRRVQVFTNRYSLQEKEAISREFQAHGKEEIEKRKKELTQWGAAFGELPLLERIFLVTEVCLFDTLVTSTVSTLIASIYSALLFYNQYAKNEAELKELERISEELKEQKEAEIEQLSGSN